MFGAAIPGMSSYGYPRVSAQGYGRSRNSASNVGYQRSIGDDLSASPFTTLYSNCRANSFPSRHRQWIILRSRIADHVLYG
uniref:Uncharacterized protein n=1 Tax=Pseudomonas phage PACT201 TaxID=3230130 RepID=A0AAU8GTR5_9VIRU